MKGVITKTFDWIMHPTFDTQTSPKEWIAGLALILIVAFLWSRVVKQVIEAEI